jgi:mannose-6-phosphate isomerase-like protein (cupin superfamily)
VNTKGDKMPQGIAHIPPGEGRSLRVLGELVTCKTTSERTGGAYSLFEVASQPDAGPPPHIQHREEEVFWVLQGRYEFLIEGRALRASARSLIYIPRGTLHSHKNVGESLGRMLVSQTPGGLYERFFEEVGAPVKSGIGPLAFEDQLALQRIVAIAAQYGIEIPTPVPQ